MRRTDGEIRNRVEIEEIIANATVCRLALSDNGQPYVVPMNFGYRDGALYFHSAPHGRKIDIIGRNTRVCFEIDADIEIVRSDRPCEWSMRYRSVIGFGTASLIESPAEKRSALAVIGKHYTHLPFEVPDEQARRIAIIKVTIDEMTGKCSGCR
ncbi:MAG TPA: pyridoxamine 5'-phosphate oxidase family protein [Patescibacteria group bacterium]|nr:pyridoxamine 5'-phosphate oxidase family protein [Patescibacteria group bacterium]